jgi:hypothetical protein
MALLTRFRFIALDRAALAVTADTRRCWRVRWLQYLTFSALRRTKVHLFYSLPTLRHIFPGEGIQ